MLTIINCETDQTEINNLNQRIDALTIANNNLETQISGTTTTITGDTATIMNLQNQLSTLSGSNSTLQSLLNALSGASAEQIRTLQSLLNSLSGNNSTLLNQLNALSGASAMTITTLQTQINTLIPFQAFTLDASNDSPDGIWSDGTTMWVADTTDDKLYAYHLTGDSRGMRNTGQDFNTLSGAGNNSPSEIWSDGTTMWVADFFDTKLYAYNLRTKARDAAKDLNTFTGVINFNPAGLWSDGTTMWVADAVLGTPKIYAYHLTGDSRGMRNTDQDFNTLEEVSNSGGIWSDGTTMWVAEKSGNTKIEAYNLGDKARNATKVINIRNAGNNSPRGIWSDGTTMWVIDSHDDKIYAYPLPR